MLPFAKNLSTSDYGLVNRPLLRHLVVVVDAAVGEVRAYMDGTIFARAQTGRSGRSLEDEMAGWDCPHNNQTYTHREHARTHA